MDKLNFFGTYLRDTPWFRKIGDALLAALLILVYGFATGKIDLPKVPPHSVKASFDTSREIQKVLDVYQNKTGANFVGHFRFHNGSQSINGVFHFMKYSLTEYSSKLGIMVAPEEMQSTPIVANMSLVGAMVANKCYTAEIDSDSPKYLTALKMNLTKYTACPIYDRASLVGFVVFGVGPTKAVEEHIALEAAKEIQVFRR